MGLGSVVSGYREVLRRWEGGERKEKEDGREEKAKEVYYSAEWNKWMG